MWKTASKWLKKAWWGVIVAHLTIFGTVYLGIWGVLEPMGVADDFTDFPTFVKKRIYFHLVGTAVLSAYLTVILLVFNNYQNRDSNISTETYGIKIHHPSPGSEVSGNFDISGTYLIRPSQDVIRIIEFGPDSHEYWPKNPLIFNEKEKTWHVTVHSGRINQKGEFIVAYIGENGALLLKYFEKVNIKSKERFSKEAWFGINALPKDIIECDKVSVIIRSEKT